MRREWIEIRIGDIVTVRDYVVSLHAEGVD